MTGKIFGIGLPKTGTSSLGRCFEILGLSKAPYNLELINNVAGGERQGLDEMVAKYDSFEDWPWPVLYQELDQAYPEARFILTLREDEHVWLRSLQKHTARNTQANSKWLREKFFGHQDPWQGGDHYKAFYRKHEEEVKCYFSGRPEKLLIVNWESGDGWAELCAFLGYPVPDIDFPHINPAEGNSDFRKFLRGIKKRFWS